ncbi:hypothetical protein BDY21DRAFT_128692 [Lineolata rhizophorae]|uniref:TLC domain-containing protein n=1 Tax=Lineolata rhizophorae TaxID=578093 RepID=A0A6A6NNP3_9PEZI|nr:hypothetical protein BDY21DRAFT_128692 [Lineolata rhizophorae]
MMAVSPYLTAGLSASTYAFLLRFLSSKNVNAFDRNTRIKGISALHAIISSIITIYALNTPSQWTPVGLTSQQDALRLFEPSKPRSPSAPAAPSAAENLDDSLNPMIKSRSDLANKLTAWETGYLIYDTYALLHLTSLKLPSRSDHTPKAAAAVRRAAAESPVVLAHHVLLACALGTLQVYNAARRERGVWVILAFMLMNASTPVLHLHWYLRRRMGCVNALADAVLVAVFALARFGPVYAVLEKYGQFHGLSAWEAYRRLRWVCQAGTGMLVVANLGWWGALVWRAVAPRRNHGMGMMRKTV